MDSSSNDVIDRTIEEVCGVVQKMTVNVIHVLISKWNDMYDLSDEEKRPRLLKLTEYIEEFYDGIAQSEEDKKTEMLAEIDRKLKDYYELQKILAMNEDIHKMEIMTPYNKFLRDIDRSHARFLEEKEKRLNEAKKLRSEEQELCEELGLPPLPQFAHSIPTEQELQSLQLKVFELHEEKINLQRTYKKLKSIIINLSSILEREPVTQFEQDLLAQGDDFQPSTDYVKRLENLKNILQKQHDETIERRQYLIEKLTKLWDRLKLEPYIRESFLVRYSSISKTDMSAIEEEIHRCEQLKRENMKQVIESAREQISQLWDKLTYSQEQRQQFKPFLSNHYSEDVLELHELEIERLQHFYLTNQHIFELAEKRNDLWQRMLHLDELAQDKNRLFSNRGGQLLKEEKERKDLEVNLPKVDKQLKTALAEYGKPFLWHGKDLIEKITQDWEERLNSKMSLKLNRKIGNKKPLGSDSTNLMGSRSATKQKRMAGTPSGGGYAKVRRCDFMESATTPKKGARTPIPMTRTPLNTSNSSLASFSQFHEAIEMSAMRTALREVGNTPGVAHSSPTLATPRRATPASSKKTPQTIPRLAYCRKRLPIDI